MAGFFDLEKRGRIFSLRSLSRIDGISYWQASSINVVASIAVSSVDHGSFSDLKIAVAIMTSGELTTERSQRPGVPFALSVRMKLTAKLALRRVSFWVCRIAVGSFSQTSTYAAREVYHRLRRMFHQIVLRIQMTEVQGDWPIETDCSGLELPPLPAVRSLRRWAVMGSSHRGSRLQSRDFHRPSHRVRWGF